MPFFVLHSYNAHNITNCQFCLKDIGFKTPSEQNGTFYSCTNVKREFGIIVLTTNVQHGSYFTNKLFTIEEWCKICVILTKYDLTENTDVCQ